MNLATDAKAGEMDEMAGKKSPEPKEPEKPKTLFAVKGTESWFDWLKRYAEFMGVPAMTAIDLALRDAAKKQGFPDPMPKRNKGGS